MISERGKFYTTRFGRSDPSLTRQVILGFSISLPVWLSVGEEASGGRERKREVWNEIDQEDASQVPNQMRSSSTAQWVPELRG